MAAACKVSTFSKPELTEMGRTTPTFLATALRHSLSESHSRLQHMDSPIGHSVYLVLIEG
jgi:hypothetical protein